MYKKIFFKLKQKCNFTKKMSWGVIGIGEDAEKNHASIEKQDDLQLTASHPVFLRMHDNRLPWWK